jgi:acyl-CoA synthetase (AMP-forming)/AMP-acid ligase II
MPAPHPRVILVDVSALYRMTWKKHDKRIDTLSNTLATNYIQKGDKLGSFYPNGGLQKIENLDDAWL